MKLLKVVYINLFLLLLILPSYSADDYSTWSYSETIELNTTSTGANIGADVIDFPVLIRLNTSNFGGFSNTNAGGSDIRFAKTDGTHLSYEIERWADGTSDVDTAEIWVLVDTVKGNSKTDIKMYYGNSSAVDSSNSEAVFSTSNGFAGVWHLEESGDEVGEDYLDATANNNDGQGGRGTATAVTSQTTGMIGKGQDFDGTDDIIFMEKSTSLQLTGNFTLNFWIKPVSNSWLFVVANDEASDAQGYYWRLGSDSGAEFMIADGAYSASASPAGAISFEAWHHVIAFYDTANDVVEQWFDGVKTVTTTITKTIPASDSGTVLGGSNFGTNHYKGIIDEMRISNVVRDSNWIKLCYANQKASQTLTSFKEDYSSDWNSYKTIYLNTTSTGANIATDVTDFPVLVRLNPSNFENFSSTKAGGADIRFAKADGTHLSYEIERWVDGTSDVDTAEIWVLVDTVQGNDSTEIRMYYDNSDASDSSNGASVFSANNGFIGVWHMDNESGTIYDQTNSSNITTITGTTNKTGIIGNGQDIDIASTDKDVIPYNSNQEILGADFTISWWMNSDDDFDTITNRRTIISNQCGDSGYALFLQSDNDKMELEARATDDWVYNILSSKEDWDVNTNYYGTLTFDASANEFEWFFDGVADSTISLTKTWVNSTDDDIYIGHYQCNGDDAMTFNGLLDEIRIENVERSTSWIKLCYENQKNTQTLVEFGDDAVTWDGSSSANWNTSANWVDGAVPVDNDLIAFNSSSTTNLSTTNDISGLNGLGIEVTNPSGDITITHATNTIGLGSRGIRMGSATQNLTLAVPIALEADQSWNVASSRTLTVSSAVSGSYALTKIGDGTLILSATNTYTGVTTVSAGTLDLTGTVAGALTVNSGGTLETSTSGVADGSCGGNFTLSSGGTFVVDINGATTAGTDYDQIAVTGTVTLGGSLTMNLNCIPGSGQSYKIIDNDGSSDAVSGTFNGVAEGGEISASYDGKKYYFTVSYIGGDGNDVVISTGENYTVSWPYSANITLNTTATGSNVANTVTNFPVLVRLNPGVMSEFANTNAGGSDIRFAKADGTHLSYEIERWSDGTNDVDTAEIWVLVDSVLGNDSTTIKMYFGKSDATSKSDSSAVFSTSNGFAGVWHLEEDGNTTADGYKDATANGNHCTGTAMTTSSDVNCVIGKGQTFSGSADSLACATSSTLQVTGDQTLSFWLNPTNFDAQSSPVDKSYGGELATKITTDSSFYYFWGNSTADGDYSYIAGGIGFISSATWTYLTISRNFSDDSITLYKNGSLYNTNTGLSHSPATASSNNFIIGDGYAGNFLGELDEVRLENVARSSDWVKLCYENQKASQTLVEIDSIVLIIESSNLQAVTLKRTSGTSSDTALIYTDNWSLVFDEDNGGGIKWFSNDSAHGGTNVVPTGLNLYYAILGTDTSSSGSGTLTLLDSSNLFVRLRQKKTLGSQDFNIDYTIYGSGRINVNTSAYNTSGSDIVDNTLSFHVAKDPSGTVLIRPYSSTAGSCPSILVGDDGSSANDILFSVYDTLGAIGNDNHTTAFDTATSASLVYAGYKLTGYDLENNTKDNWSFMIDFGYKTWNDTNKYNIANTTDYRTPDALDIYKGSFAMEHAWENSIKGEWKFDDGSGDTARDASGEDNHAYVSGTVVWSDGVKDGGLTLSLDSVVVGNKTDFDLSEEFTIMAWIKPSTAIDENTVIMGKHDGSTGYIFGGSSDGKLKVTLNGWSGTANTAIGTGIWHHVALVSDYHAGYQKLFIDGRVDVVFHNKPIISANTASALIGKGFSGEIDDVRFYKSVILDEYIKAVAEGGYRPDMGAYTVRADNNGTSHFKIDGSSVARVNPVFEVTNYWKSDASNLKVYVNQTAQTLDSDYFASVDATRHVLRVGLNRRISDANTWIYIDGDNATGAYKTDEMPKMYYGVDVLNSVDYVWVKNFSGTTWGSASDNQFYMNWKMSTSDANDGDLWFMTTTATTTNTELDTATNTNMIYTGGAEERSWGGFFTHTSDAYPATSQDVETAFTYSIKESSDVRVIIKIGERVVDEGTSSFKISTECTIYPTGQIFYWDSISTISSTGLDYIMAVFYLKVLESPTIYRDQSNMRAVSYGGSILQDFAVAHLSFSNSDGYYATPYGSMNPANDAIVTGFDFVQGEADTAKWQKTPVQACLYADIQNNDMDTVYMDSVAIGVQKIEIGGQNALIMKTDGGTLVTNSAGDLNEDGFNEREGAYIVQASNNRADFTIPANGDTCRFNPAFRITNYYAADKPMYVYLYTASDSFPLIEGYGYNIFHDKPNQQLIIQLDTVICTNTNVFIDADVDLAVTMGDFSAKPGDGNDTLFWRTESEKDNLGFYLYRRVNPDFIDSVKKAMSILESNKDSSNLILNKSVLRFSDLDYSDTSWSSIVKDIIPGAPGGNSYGSRSYRYVDKNVNNNVLYEYKLVSVEYNSRTRAYGPVKVMPVFMAPAELKLWGASPNPFKNSTVIKYSLPQKTRVSLSVFNLQGQMVAKLVKPNKVMNAGWYTVTWDGKDKYGMPLAKGPYIYRLSARKSAQSKIIIRVK